MFRLTPLTKRIRAGMHSSSIFAIIASMALFSSSQADDNSDLATEMANAKPSELPLSVASNTAPPLVMIAMSREHTMMSEAYTDYDDIDGDGIIDIMYDPSITYEGNFEPDLCYKYSSSTSSDLINSGVDFANVQGHYWYPVKEASTKNITLSLWKNSKLGQSRDVNICGNKSGWLGNFLNYVTTSKIDVIRRVLYGGTRVFKDGLQVRYDANGDKGNAFLRHSSNLRDAHMWGKVLANRMYDNGTLKVSDITELDDTKDDIQHYEAYFFMMGSESKTFETKSGFLRYGLVKRAGVPGKDASQEKKEKGDTSTDPFAYIWDWTSRESTYGNGHLAYFSKNICYELGDNNHCLFNYSLTDTNQCGNSSNGNVTDRSVVVATCTEKFHNANHCRLYEENTSNYQPYGFLQEFGEGNSPRMKFGLITGSWNKHISGASLRANIGDLNKEIVLSNEDNKKLGDFKKPDCVNGSCGFSGTLDGFNINAKLNGTVYDDCSREDGYGYVKDGAIMPDYKCKDWGNPVSHLMYASLQYFKNAKEYFNDANATEGNTKIGYSKYKDPYANTNSTSDYCAEPNVLLIADENVSFDDSTYNETLFSQYSTTLKSLKEFSAGKYFVGRVGDSNDLYNYIPSLKQINDLSEVSGIAPSAAYSHGSYLTAAIAQDSSSNTIRTTSDKEGHEKKQSLKTYVVAMKPSLPEIKISVGENKYVSILPFARTTCDSDTTRETWKTSIGTNTVVDFFTERFTDTEGVFRINYEDNQYGSDYDMDWVVEYKYKIHKYNGNTYVQIITTSLSGDGYSRQHAGYVISGVENEGAYIDIAKHTSKDHGNWNDPMNNGGKNKGFNNNWYELDNIVSDYNLLYIEKNRYFKNKFTRDNIWETHNELFNGDSSNAKAADKDNYEKLTPEQINYLYTELISQVKCGDKPLYYLNRRQFVYECGKPYKESVKSQGIIYLDGFNGSCLDYDSPLGKYCGEGNDNKPNPYRQAKHLLMGDYNRENDAKTPVSNSRIFKVKDSADDSWMKSPLWYAAKYGLPEDKRTTNENGDPNNYYQVTNPSLLRKGIAQMLLQIDNQSHTGSNMGSTAKTIKTGENGTVGYAPMFYRSNWIGDIRKVKYGSQGIISSYYPNWSAKTAYQKVDADNRAVFIYNRDIDDIERFYAQDSNDGEISYSINIANKILSKNFSTMAELQGNKDYAKYISRFTRWMLGEHDYEGGSESTNDKINFAVNGNYPLRLRNNTAQVEENKKSSNYFVLGDIINSSVVTFTSKGKEILAVGANDGMLHFINAVDASPILAYIPSVALPKITKLASQNYDSSTHVDFVNVTPEFLKDSSGNMYLYGTFGLGLEGGYAFNVKNLGDAVGESVEKRKDVMKNSFLWELIPSTSTKNSEGNTINVGSDLVGKMKASPALIYGKGTGTERNEPYLVFNSGYDAVKPGIIIVKLKGKALANRTAPIVNEIDLSDYVGEDPRGWKRANVPAPIQILEMDGDHTYQAMYWGDNFGYLWKIDLNNDDIQNAIPCWGFKNCSKSVTDGNGSQQAFSSPFDSSPKKVFQAVDSDGNAQPITTRPALGFHNDGIGIIFGTGSYDLDVDGKKISQTYNTTQSVYMVRDNSSIPQYNVSKVDYIRRCNKGSSAPGCLALVEESSTFTDEEDKDNTTTFALSNGSGSINYGWYFDLGGTKPDGQPRLGERTTVAPIILGDQMIVVPNTPTSSTCNGGGISRIITGNWIAFSQVQTSRELDLLANTVEVKMIDNKPTIMITGDMPLGKDIEQQVTYEPAIVTNKVSSWLKLY